ncbi:hypothetical protein DFA_07877 [Cavenderia fasciculata]|uniref:F-box domain-containing protein n=1 Tax=Cavenderia fasciculata TaxID=261658 RepID=F4Q3T0_CACFS|nr:uncharacterized protein DFA_07877 [Cavenderia fasciculata]EGG16896.1 hypothetical protein DFA_07877 [Cavenderia fasciculata]|eukprot:XP_004355370.1 hypothetical protein DFA_07877 [Cavenderia fasciculata]
MSCLWIENTQSAGWMDIIIKDQQHLPLKKLIKYEHAQVTIPLALCHYLEKVYIDFSKNTCQEICDVLSSFHHLKSLDINIKRCIGLLDIDKVFSSLPRKTLTKLKWGPREKDSYYNPSAQPFPFHLLPTTLTKFYMRDRSQAWTLPYYDYVFTNSVRSITQHNHPTKQLMEYISSPSSPVTHLHLIVNQIASHWIKGLALVPPSLQVLTLESNCDTYQIDCILKYSGPLPNLHTIKIEPFKDIIKPLISFMAVSKSLRVIDFYSDTFAYSFYQDKSLETFLSAIANSISVERVYFRKSMVKYILGDINSLQTSFSTLSTTLLLPNNDLIIFNLINNNNNHIDLSSYQLNPLVPDLNK